MIEYCSHKIVSMNSNPYCQKIAKLCNNHCQQQDKEHSTKEHIIIDLESFSQSATNIVKLAKQKLNVYKQKVYQIALEHQARIKENRRLSLEQIDDMLASLLAACSSLEENSFLKIINQRVDRVCCSEVYEIMKIKNTFKPIISATCKSQLQKIVSAFQKNKDVIKVTKASIQKSSKRVSKDQKIKQKQINDRNAAEGQQIFKKISQIPQLKSLLNQKSLKDFIPREHSFQNILDKHNQREIKIKQNFAGSSNRIFQQVQEPQNQNTVESLSGIYQNSKPINCDIKLQCQNMGIKQPKPYLTAQQIIPNSQLKITHKRQKTPNFLAKNKQHLQNYTDVAMKCFSAYESREQSIKLQRQSMKALETDKRTHHHKQRNSDQDPKI